LETTTRQRDLNALKAQSAEAQLTAALARADEWRDTSRVLTDIGENLKAANASLTLDVKRLREALEKAVHNLSALKTHYLQHIRLDDVKPANLASQIGYERDRLEAALAPKEGERK
jgi:hypothetical protein